MKKIATLVFILMMTFLLIACGSDEDNSKDEEEKKQEDTEDNTKEDITFGDKEDLGEEENIEDLLSFLDEMKFPDIEFEDDELILYTEKKKIKQDEPSYRMEITYSGKLGDNHTRIRIVAFNDEKDFESLLPSEPEETETLSDGREVMMEVSSNAKAAYVEDDGLFYVFSTSKENDVMPKDTFLDAIEGMEKKNHLYDRSKERMAQSVEDYFEMPEKFPTNIKLSNVEINDNTVRFGYSNKYHTEDGEEVTSRLTYGVSEDLYGDTTEDRYDEIELPSGREAFSMPEEDENKDIIILKENGLEYFTGAKDLERPQDSEEMENIIEIIDSVKE